MTKLLFLNVIKFVSAILIFSLPQLALAEPKIGDKFGDWVFECSAIAEGKTACALTQTIVAQKDNRRIVKFSFARDDKKSINAITALLPLGIDLASGVSGSIDQGKPFQYQLKTCIQQGCIVTYAVDSTFLKSLQSAKKLNISFMGVNATKPVAISGSLNGVSDGLKAININ